MRTKQTPKTIPSSHNRRLAKGSIKLLVILQVLLVVTVVSAVLFISRELRQEALKNMQSHLHVQTHNLEDRLTHSFELLRIHLESLVNEYPGVNSDPLLLSEALFNVQHKLPFVRSLSVLDKNGQIQLSTQLANISKKPDLEGLLPRLNKEQTMGLLRFGQPWQGRDFADGKPFAYLEGAKGDGPSFVPVVMAVPELGNAQLLVAISSDYFINLATHQGLQDGITHRVYNHDGLMLFSTSAKDQPGTMLPNAEQIRDILFTHMGDGVWADEDGLARLSAYRTSNNYPWFVYSRIKRTDVLEDWIQGTRSLWAFTVFILVLMLLVTSTLTYRMRRSLLESEALFEERSQAAIVFSHSSDLMAVLDSDGRVIKINPIFTELTGFCEQECQGQLLTGFFPDGEKIFQAMQISSKWEGEVEIGRKDGKQITGWLVVNAIHNADKELINYVTVFTNLSQIQAHEEEIRKFSKVVEQSPSSIIVTSPVARIEYANPEFYRATGYSRQEVIGNNPRFLQSGQTSRETYIDLWRTITAGKVWRGTFINKRKNGEIFYERSIVSPLVDEQGVITGYVGIKHDVTTEMEAERNMRLAANVLQNTLEGVVICDEKQRIIEVNPAFSRITGYSREEVLGQHPSMLRSGKGNAVTLKKMYQALKDSGQWQGELWNRHKDGRNYAISLSVRVIYDNDRQIANYISIFSDVTEQKRQQQTLEKRAHFDLLTGLPNRALLFERLRQAIINADSDEHWFGLCFLDLDGFKKVNDTHGHDAGDDLLVIMAQRLKECLRAHDVVARLGGDEFVVILNYLHSIDEARQVAERILNRAQAPITVAGQIVHVSASMGITIYPLDNSDVDGLMHHADVAMYAAKKAGRNRYVFAQEALSKLTT